MINQYLLIAVLSLLISGSGSHICAQRRQRPDSMRHTEADVANARKTETVKCTYVRDGKSFYADAWAVGAAGKMKIGTVVLSFNKGHYRLNFTATEVYTRETVPMWERPKYNPWRLEKLGNDFVQRGRYETFSKFGRLYLRLYDGDSNRYITDIPLNNKDTSRFTLFEEDWLMEFINYE